MVGIYVGGTSAYCGKHTIAMSLAVTLQEQGYRIGYMKPVGTLPLEKDGKTGDEDAFFMQEVLGLRLTNLAAIRSDTLCNKECREIGRASCRERV